MPSEQQKFDRALPQPQSANKGKDPARPKTRRHHFGACKSDENLSGNSAGLGVTAPSREYRSVCCFRSDNSADLIFSLAVAVVGAAAAAVAVVVLVVVVVRSHGAPCFGRQDSMSYTHHIGGKPYAFNPTQATLLSDPPPSVICWIAVKGLELSYHTYCSLRF